MTKKSKKEPADPEPVELSGPQLAAIELLVTGKRKIDVAATTGVTPTTISRWFAVPEFVAALNARRLDIHEGSADRLRSLASKAVDILETALSSATLSEQLKAATLVLKATGLATLDTPDHAVTADAVRRQQREQERLAADADNKLFWGDVSDLFAQKKREEEAQAAQEAQDESGEEF